MVAAFDDRLSSEQAIVSEFSEASDSLLVAFGGVGAGLGMPPFEFFRLAAEIPTKKMFIRDLEQAWYQRGLPGISKDVRGTLAYLEQELARQNVRRTVFVGNSMGAYAAILFGWLLEIDVVHAFAPQSFIGRFQRLLALDRRWRPQMQRVHTTPHLSREFLDLKRVLAGRPKRTMIHLYFADQHRLDRLHCRRLEGLRNVVLHPYPHAGHNLIKQLRDEGALEDILRQSLRPQEAL
jgi:hypothetical protein